MIDFDFLGADEVTDALIMEVASLLKNLIVHDRPGTIDLLGLPLSPSSLASLDQRLGQGEISAVLNAAGTSQIHETGFPGVWWTSHADETGRIVAMLIEVAIIPEILRADLNDMRIGHERLLTSTNFSRRQKSA